MVTKHSGFFIQSSYGTKGNFEVVFASATGGLVRTQRNNDLTNRPWIEPQYSQFDSSFGKFVYGDFFASGEVLGASLIQSNFIDSGSSKGHLELVARIGDKLTLFWRTSEKPFIWNSTLFFASGVSGNPALIQSSYETKGNFEVVVPLASGGLAHYTRNNDQSGVPWGAPTVFATNLGQVNAVALIQSNYGTPGQLHAIARVGNQLRHLWRDSNAPFAWHDSGVIFTGATGIPAFIQSTYGTQGNFEVVTPLSGGGMAYLSRNNDNPTQPWSAPITIGGSLGQIDAAALIQGNFGTPGNLELIARVGNKLSHFWYSFSTKQWTGPIANFSEPTGNLTTQGEWRVAYSLGPLPNNNGVMGIHAALLHTNKVLFFGFQESSDAICTACVLDLANGVQTQVNPKKNKFCAGQAFLADGRLVVASGHASEANAKSLHTFTPNATAGTWQDLGNMNGGTSNGGRWYPNCTKLPNGNVMILGGADGEGRVINPGNCQVEGGKRVNDSYEIFDGTSLQTPVSIPIFNDYITNAGPYGLYPFVFVLPNGKLFVHARNLTYILNPTTGTFDSLTGLPTKAKTARHYPSAGTCVLLPLLPANNYKARVMLIGGGASCIKNANGTFTRIDDQGNPVAGNVQNAPATKTCEILDLSVTEPAWQFTPSMSQPRVMPDSVLLPDGKVLVVGGSRTGGADNATNPVLDVELYDPNANTWTLLGKMHVPRLYHSSAFLLPTGEVMTAGKDKLFNPSPFNYPEYRVEIFKPPYLLKGARPTVSSAPTAIAYNSAFNIQTPDAASIASAVLMAPAAVTHSFNMHQRYVGLTFSTASGGLTLQAPSNSNIAPPGYYMLFIVNSNGVPSVAKFVRLS